MFYAQQITPEHMVGARVIELVDNATRKGDAYCAAMIALPDGREAYVKAYRSSSPRKPDPAAP